MHFDVLGIPTGGFFVGFFFLSISSSIDLNLDLLVFGYLLKAKNDAAMNTSEFFINIKRY